jgi:hypothetical protein
MNREQLILELSDYGVHTDCLHECHVCGYIWLTKRKGLEFIVYPCFDGSYFVTLSHWIEKPKWCKRMTKEDRFEGASLQDIKDFLDGKRK